ncbi:acetolactate synthase-1/2/3 large subunit [Rhizobiales bacterium GAS191]|nr:acetolactate synthase-1/2/3 large subunit [Rhizobiales bacterium GAS191]SEC64844.1 acetolactate synthase-1/2/3 large subunit [Rhizobiales bacterium GAS188]
MNGAESLVRTLVAGGVEVCFSNPGTSEMHFVTALDRVDGMRCILGLFEGVVTGAADGYARMADKPAATLLHLGPGLANGLANLHNAHKASTAVVNIVGDHAVYHRRYDAPLTSDIESAAKTVSSWVRTSPDSKSVAADGAAAIAAARTSPGQVATLILPADTAWNNGSEVAAVPPVARPSQVSKDAVAEAARVLRSGEPTLILLGGRALRQGALELAGRIAAKTGARLMSETSGARTERGAGRVPVDRVPYPVDQAVEVLKGFKHLILVGARAPVAFFAYPDKPSVLAPPDSQSHLLARRDEDIPHALEWLADELGARNERAPIVSYAPTKPASGAINPDTLGQSIGALLPENAIVIDESITTGRSFAKSTRASHAHDWLQNMGGSIGLCMPLAVGAAVACPDRKVVALESDGSGMYTLQALWTQAREKLNIVTLVFANRTYGILHHELTNVGAKNVGRKALDMLDIDRPDLDWVAMARGMGVPGTRVETMEAFNASFAEGVAMQGPYLIEVVL